MSKTSTEYFGKLSIEDIRVQAPKDTLRFFDDLAEARGWLRSA